VRDSLAGGPVRFLGFRPVPTNEDALPPRAKLTRPATIEHVLLQVTGEPAAVERWLFLRRLEMRAKLEAAGLRAYLPSLSARLVSYKGLFTSPQLADFYADLSDPAFETGIATFHRRYSTNTFPNWTLAQPFRMTCHNGEINTVRTTRNAVHAFARGLNPPLPGGDLLKVDTVKQEVIGKNHRFTVGDVPHPGRRGLGLSLTGPPPANAGTESRAACHAGRL
jgi:glutamate synthase domain-containing protein 1